MSFELLDLGRARIVPFADRHLGPRYAGWLNDRQVVRYSEQRHRSHDLASCEAYFRSAAASGNLFLAIEASDPALGHVGNMTASFDPPNRTCDLSIMVGEAAARGTGIGSLAWCAMVDWLLGPGGQRRVTAGTMAENRAMLALMAKSGMTVDAVRARAFLLDSREFDLVMAVQIGIAQL